MKNITYENYIKTYGKFENMKKLQTQYKNHNIMIT